MTEYEAASLTIQEASLAIQRASLAAQQASVWVAALVGAAQCSLIAYGLYFMRQAARHRDAQHRETMKALDTRQIIIGSPDTVVRQLNELRVRFRVGHLGVSHFAVEDYGRTMRNLELLGEEVFPRLRELAAGD